MSIVSRAVNFSPCGAAVSIMLTWGATQASGSLGRAAKPRRGLASVIAPALRLRPREL